MKQLVNFFGRQAKSQVQETLRKPARRQLRNEALEQRQLLAGDLLAGDLLVGHNYAMPEDVSGDWRVTPLDALMVLNHISRSGGSSSLEGLQPGDLSYFPDVTATGDVTPLDALRVLNRIARGEAANEPLLQLHLNARTADDASFSAAAFNTDTRELMIGVGEIFNLEVNYTDLRFPGSERLGAFQIAVDILFDTGILEPALTELQELRFSSNLGDARSGNILFNLEGRTEPSISFDFEDFDDNPVGVIRDALNQLEFDDVTVLFGGSGIYDIRFNDRSLVNQDLPNLIVQPQLFGANGAIDVTGAVRDITPRINGAINPAAIRHNLDFDSRTISQPFDERSGRSFYGGLVFDGSFNPERGLIGLTGVGPTVPNGWPDFDQNNTLPRPFDAFSIPVQFVQAVNNFEIRLNDSTVPGSRNLMYGTDQDGDAIVPGPDEIVIGELSDEFVPKYNAAGILTNAPGTIIVTAVSDGAVTVSAGNGTLPATQNGPPATFDLSTLVTVGNGDGLPISYSLVSDPAFGGVTINPTTGLATYTPSETESGTTTFVYSATVGGVTDTGTITVNVSALPVSVVAGDGSLDAVQGGPAETLELSPLVDVTNGEGLPRSFVITSHPAFGAATVNQATGRLTYTPPADTFGATTLDYSVTVNGVTDTGTISIDVARQPVDLTANPGSLTAFQNGTPVQINLNNLISVTPAGTQVTFELILPDPTLGTAVLGANGVVTYTPSATQSGPDSFGYRVTSLGDDEQVAESTVSVTVNEEITITAGDDQFEAIEGGAPIVISPFPGALVATTGPAATPTITLNTSGLQGNVEFSGGVLTYTPPAFRFGTDSFSYTASLAAMPGFAGASDQGVITITEVASITARDSSITALPGDPAQVINLANLVTVTGTDDLPVFTLDTTGLAGTAVPNGNTVTYTPPDTEFGTTSFSYTATVAGKSATATVTISEGVSIETSPGSLVSFPGGPPVTLSLPTLVTISGSEEAPIYALATAPSIGSAEVNPSTGLLTYTPPATGPIGQISFTYRVTVEGISVTDTVTVTELTVVAPDRTLAVDEAQPNVTPPGTTLQLSATVSVALPAAFTIVSPPSLGTATIVGNVLTYTPRDFDFDQTVFTDSIVYQAAVNGVSDTGTIAITINPTVLPPVAVADSVNAVADTFTTYTSAQLTQNDSPARPNPSGLRPVVTDAAAIPGVTAGTVVFNAADNSVTFTPAPTFVGETSFNYTMTSEGQTSTATVTVNVREFDPSTISGSIFTDYIESVSNPVRNGVRDANEPAMGGVPVRLTSPASQNLFGQDIDQLVLTDAEGGYVFDDVPPGIYEVSFETPDTLVFGASSNGSSLPAQVSGQTFTLEVGPDGGLTYSGMNFTVLGRKGLAAGTGTLLVSQYLLSSPNSPYNSSRPDFGLATMIVNPSNGTQQVFELAQGFDGVVFAEIAVGRSGNTALLTLIMEDATVKTALLSKDNGDFVINSTRAVIQVFRNVGSMTFIGSAADVLEAEYGNYREAVDQVLAAGMF